MTEAKAIGFVIRDVPNAFRDRARLRRWLHRVAHDHGSRIDSISFVLMNEKEHLSFNERFLGHTDHTDVITFPVESNNGVAGDILLSYDRIKENAATFGCSAALELRRVMVHGLLHLLGHQDKTQKQRRAMREQEDHYLAKFPKL